jgi:hypothetical protein
VKAFHHIEASSAENLGAFITGLDTVNLSYLVRRIGLAHFAQLRHEGLQLALRVEHYLHLLLRLGPGPARAACGARGARRLSISVRAGAGVVIRVVRVRGCRSGAPPSPAPAAPSGRAPPPSAAPASAPTRAAGVCLRRRRRRLLSAALLAADVLEVDGRAAPPRRTPTPVVLRDVRASAPPPPLPPPLPAPAAPPGPGPSSAGQCVGVYG